MEQRDSVPATATLSTTADAPNGQAVQSPTAMLTVAAAAKLLGLGRTTLYEILERGELPSYRFGRARRIDPADLERFKEACRVDVAPHYGFCAGVQTNGR